MSLSLNFDYYDDNKLTQRVRFHRPTAVKTTDCRSNHVGIEFGTKHQECTVYLDPDIARQLHHQLGKLFPGDDVVGLFQELFGVELTCDNLRDVQAQWLTAQSATDLARDNHLSVKVMRNAIEAMVRWFDAEQDNLGTFHQKMDLCKYAEWAARKAVGQDVGKFEGAPRIVLKPAQAPVDFPAAVESVAATERES